MLYMSYLKSENLILKYKFFGLTSELFEKWKLKFEVQIHLKDK